MISSVGSVNLMALWFKLERLHFIQSVWLCLSVDLHMSQKVDTSISKNGNKTSSKQNIIQNFDCLTRRYLLIAVDLAALGSEDDLIAYLV